MLTNLQLSKWKCCCSLWLSFCRYCIYQQHYVAAEERNISSSNNFLHHIRCSSATASFQDFPPLGFFRRLVVMLTWLVISVVPSFFSWYLHFSLLYLTSLSLSFLYLHFVKVNLIWSNFKIHQWTGQINRIGSSWLWSCHGIDFWCRHPSNTRTVEETL